MSNFATWVSSILFLVLGVQMPNSRTLEELPSPTIVRHTAISEEHRDSRESRYLNDNQQIVFEHGNVDWLAELALKVGWPAETIERLEQIVLRESGGCPNRRGGDIVDKDCNITGVAERTHRSDSGLLQINGVNYDISRNKWAPLCKEMDICSKDDQWQLLDAETNLKAGLILYKLVGWSPWDPCQWDKTKCPKKTKP